MQLSENTYQKLVALVDALVEENPKLDRRIKCAVLQKRGGTVAIQARGLSVEQLERWFWSNVKINEQTRCWEWQGMKDSNGYGRIKIRGKRVLAHRLSLLYFGKQSPLFACHRCDNPPCVNPFHIFWGTRQDNFDDAKQKGRLRYARGSEMPQSKLTPGTVKMLRNSKLPKKQLARIFSVSRATIRSAINRNSWKHI